MGMTIEESKKLLFQYKKLFNSLNGNYKLSQVQISELSHSISIAVETMRKYQKIEQIVNDELKDFHPLDRNPYKIGLIKEVLEDGKID